MSIQEKQSLKLIYIIYRHYREVMGCKQEDFIDGVEFGGAAPAEMPLLSYFASGIMLHASHLPTRCETL